MRRLLALVLALCTLLALAAPAVAATYTVDDPGDYPQRPADGVCDAEPGGRDECTLREAIVEANATAAADTIAFAPAIATVTPLTALPPVGEPTVIDGGGDVTIDAPAATAAPLLQFDSGSSRLQSIVLRGTGPGTAAPLLRANGPGFAGTAVTLRNGDGAGAEVLGAGGSLSGATVAGNRGSGVFVSGGGSSVSDSTVSGSGGHGVFVAGSGITVSRGTVHHNSGDGVRVSGQNDVVTQVVLYANGGAPIGVAPGANGGIQPPQALRVGPRRADGSLPLTGSTSGGSIELFTGSPFSSLAPAYGTSFGVEPGAFAYSFPSEPAPGTTFALTLTAGGTSQFALVSVPDDVVSPDVANARAVSTTQVVVSPTEPIEPGSVQASDFRLLMAGAERPVTAATAAADGTSITLNSSGWKPGEAGYVELTGAGALADAAGNASLATTRFRVAAAPGDFIAPIATRMRLAPKSICLTRGRRCRRPGASLTFVASEDGKVELVVQRGNKRVGTRTFTVKPGVSKIKFDGRLRGRKLRAGRYRLLLFMTDIVGNRNPNPPITIFSIRRVTR